MVRKLEIGRMCVPTSSVHLPPRVATTGAMVREAEGREVPQAIHNRQEDVRAQDGATTDHVVQISRLTEQGALVAGGGTHVPATREDSIRT